MARINSDIGIHQVKVGKKLYEIATYHDVMYDRTKIAIKDEDGFHTMHECDRSIEPFFAEHYVEVHEQLVKQSPGYRHKGPTNEDLKHPAVRTAWEEFQIILRLAKK